MLNLRYFFGFALCMQCLLFGADMAISGVIELSELSSSFDHSAADVDRAVKKKTKASEDAHRERHLNKLWLKEPGNTSLRVGNKIAIKKLSIVLDQSCEVAHGIHMPETNTVDVEPSLCSFSWPSCVLLHQKRLPIGAMYKNSWHETFFFQRIGFSMHYYSDYVEVIGYLPMGYMLQMQKPLKDAELHRLEFSQDHASRSQRSVYTCKTVNPSSEQSILFTFDSTTVVKDGNDKIIPWQKIEWDEDKSSS